MENVAAQLRIESLDKSTLSGSVSATDNAPVRVELTLDGLRVASTWATRAVPDMGVHLFRFNLRDIWKYCSSSRQLGVRAAGEQPVPHEDHIEELRGLPLFPAEKLQALLEDGFIFNQFGRLQLSKLKDVQWRTGILDLYARLADFLEERYAIKLIVCYGTMLGAVRGGDFIGHDHDFDAAYISNSQDPVSCRTELMRIARDLIAEGFKVTARRTCIWVYDPTNTSLKIDIFHLFFDEEGVLQFPFGVAGPRPFTLSDFKGYDEAILNDRAVNIVDDPRLFVERIYGPSWGTPNPGFNWDKDRLSDNKDAWLVLSERAEIYWDAYYGLKDPTPPSDFAHMVIKLPDIPDRIVDICCGHGADMLMFAEVGKSVVGYDGSINAVKAVKRGVSSYSGRLDAEVHHGTIDGTDGFRRLLADTARRGDEPIMFYLRFVLHALSDRGERALMSAIREVSRPGDVIAFEFRTTKDEERKKNNNKAPFRRYIDVDAFLGRLHKSYKFRPQVVQEGNGFARFGREDAHVARVIGKRR
ncbi:hypothetical protein [Hansschlegelia plantiphila]|uniref:Class I SAM-dependent methyltransferase n=1 Tax=Hansschlegelia plantiphila TaxID=374655 RepID=A0A9W6J2I5_9HYPH|nr:hypothetical protein [Hansschlegelia plantiphila]GLK68090.1 hypothetical protein GCM10008179_17280 [Hansschlegelia plantiphila]